MIRCPACRSKGSDIVLNEIWAGDSMEFEQNDDGSINPEGLLIKNSDPIKVQGFCLICKRVWTLRGVTQITDLSMHPDKTASGGASK